MDDLRSGRLQPRRASSSGFLRKGYLHIAFPPRKVLIVGGCHAISREIIKDYLKLDCRVAVMDSDSVRGEEMALKEGVRFIKAALSDKERVEASFANLMKAWLDVDIIINIAEKGSEEEKASFLRILNLWIAHRKRFTIPNDYGGRYINISLQATGFSLPEMDATEKLSLEELGITQNTVIAAVDDFENLSRSCSKICLFLSAPGNDFLNNQDFTINVPISVHLL